MGINSNRSRWLCKALFFPVRPCFFHDGLGNIHQQSLTEILNSKEAINFRKSLDMATNPTCIKCVCSLNLSPLTPIN